MNQDDSGGQQDQHQVITQHQPRLLNSRHVPQSPSQELDGPTHDPRMCETHQDELILFCLKDQQKVCSKCLKSTHLLHPVVPLNSLENLDFSESLQSEIESALKEVRNREFQVRETISHSITQNKIKLRNHIIFIRDNLRHEFDDFFNNLLQSIRKDWNLFSVQEVLMRETRKFNDTVSQNLEKLTDNSQLLHPQQDIKKFYESLSEAQN